MCSMEATLYTHKISRIRYANKGEQYFENKKLVNMSCIHIEPQINDSCIFHVTPQFNRDSLSYIQPCHNRNTQICMSCDNVTVICPVPVHSIKQINHVAPFKCTPISTSHNAPILGKLHNRNLSSVSKCLSIITMIQSRINTENCVMSSAYKSFINKQWLLQKILYH
jgi:hypothetical protein